jgi:hypothetical protein
MVVAFGHPEYLQALGLRSPYPELWSLPVRVRDPQLRHLTAVLDSNRRPDWIITGSDADLAGWGIADQAAEVAFRTHYREVGYIGDHGVFLLRSESRPPLSAPLVSAPLVGAPPVGAPPVGAPPVGAPLVSVPPAARR